jgi:hypothetical protein
MEQSVMKTLLDALPTCGSLANHSWGASGFLWRRRWTLRTKKKWLFWEGPEGIATTTNRSNRPTTKDQNVSLPDGKVKVRLEYAFVIRYSMQWSSTRCKKNKQTNPWNWIVRTFQKLMLVSLPRTRQVFMIQRCQKIALKIHLCVE